MIILEVGRDKYVMDSIDDAEQVMRAFAKAKPVDQTWLGHDQVWSDAYHQDISCNIVFNKKILTREALENMQKSECVK